ncbi:hypothetical protein [Streptomyces olivaceus]|uniref:hypothetical protein n=1 Tax=Streptomyces olivaceus TaxID=47716 RepID=UPI00087879F9|nr:hypothetical protein [Streptomyces olivaceus]AOW87035.1 hypothetical protein BC342_11215 [Streptomyces olivaceus]MBZ6285049.1 hypothetical protein [Streptomyces olivaceus]
MSKSGRVVLVQVGEAVEGMTVIVVQEGQASATAASVPEPRSSWRRPVAGVLVRALSSSAALALMHGAQQIRWAEVSDWLTS